MAQVVIALGSNLDDPFRQLSIAKEFLEEISSAPVLSSSLYESEPIGPSDFDFLNAVVVIKTKAAPYELFEMIKTQERNQGRPSRYPKWTARPIDMDIIAYDDQLINTDELTIPHAEYSQRLFVLLPMQEVLPNWVDPITKKSIKKLIEAAPSMSITKSTSTW